MDKAGCFVVIRLVYCDMHKTLFFYATTSLSDCGERKFIELRLSRSLRIDEFTHVLAV